jgi:acetyl esterase/lipase
VSYGPLPGEVADICQPFLGFGARPGVLLIHGGGWAGGDKAAYSDRCQDLARQGYTVMNINYRLADGEPGHAWPAALDDAHMALGWMQKNASALDLDSKRIGVLGDSAGGQLAIFLGVNGRRFGIRCVVEESGPVDLLTAPSFVAAVSPAVFLAQPIQTTYRNASPVFSIGRDTVPMMIVHGRDDPLVPFSQAQELLAALLRQNVAVSVVPYIGGHVMQDLSYTARFHIWKLETNYLTSCLRFGSEG